MARNYNNWSNKRGASDNALNERPHVTTTVNGDKRYYSSIDAEIYFGDLFIDEVTSIEWAIQQQAMPIYGYNSYCFDDMALGTRLVQGQFAVNFIKAGFLHELQKNTSLPRIARKLYGADKKVESYFSDEFRKRLNMPVWDGGFDIVVGFGDHDKSSSSLANTMYKTFLVLDCCQITGSMVQLDCNGIPVQEIYTFMARDIKYNTATPDEKDPTHGKEENVVLKPQLDVHGTFDMASAYAAKTTPPTATTPIRIKSLNKTTLQSASLSIVTPFEDKSLNVLIGMAAGADGQLIAVMEKDKTKALRAEIDKKNLTVIKVRVDIKYYEKTATSSNNGVLKSTVYLDFEIKTK